MESSPTVHRRKSIRLSGFDYSQAGGYFVTLVTQGRECLFGEICAGQMDLNEAGKMIVSVWEALPERFPSVELDIHQLMPNHFHGIIFLHPIDPVGAGLVPAQTMATTRARAATRAAPTLGRIVGAFKSITTHEYIQGVNQFSWPAFSVKLWQRNSYEHILRSQDDYERIANYIAINIPKWDEDEENPILVEARYVVPRQLRQP